MTTPLQRKVARTITTAPPAPGFGGPGHTAVFVVEPDAFEEHDPFILLADDRLDLPEGRALGGEHPHAGFEIATFVVEGGLNEGEEGLLDTGDVLWTTAGRGIIHGERAIPLGHTRILQLWFALPERDRWIEPAFEVIRCADAPVRREPGVEARVYSGSSGPARVQRAEHVPVTLVDIRLAAGAVFEQDLPASYNGFLYVLDGELRVGSDTLLRSGQVGWLDRPAVDGSSTLQLTGRAAAARVVLYAGQPQDFSIVTHGPFVAGSRADLMRMSREYLGGQYVRMSELVKN
jgi:redox-sensitive bicupin YhaK (pirin superfamily)